MTTPRDLTALLALVALASLGLAGCGEDDAPTGPAPDPRPTLRVIHAAPEVSLVDIYLDKGDRPVVTALDHGAVSDVLSLAPGTYSLEIRGHGADPASPPVHTQDGLVLAPGAATTAVAAGLLQSADPLARFRVLVFEEDFADPGPGQAAVRLVHAAPDAPAVALDVGDDGSAEVPQLARFAATGPGGVPLPAGEPLPIGVLAGQPPARVAVFTMPPLPPGDGLFVIATGLFAGEPQGDGFSLLVVEPDGVLGRVWPEDRRVRG